MNGFAQLIAARRAELGLELDDVAEAIDRSEVVVAAWEGDRTFPEDPAIVGPLAAVLHLPEPLLAEAYAQSAPHPVSAADSEVAEGGVSALIEAVEVAPSDIDPVVPDASEPAPAITEALGVESLVGDREPVDSEDPDATEDPEAPTPEAGDVVDEEAAPIEPEPVPAASAARPERMETTPRAAYQPPVAIRADPIITPQAPPIADDSGPDMVEQVLARLAAPFEALAARFKRNRWTSRAPTSQPSYVEDRKQRTTYQLRAIFTGVAVLVMVLLMRWAWSQFADAFGSMWQTLVDAI